MNTAPKPRANTCPEGGQHTFILGTCWKCGLSIRVHKERVKETNRNRWREKKHSTTKTHRPQIA